MLEAYWKIIQHFCDITESQTKQYEQIPLKP